MIQQSIRQRKTGQMFGPCATAGALGQEKTEALRAFEAVICAGLDTRADSSTQALARATVRAYAKALERYAGNPGSAAWTVFVCCADTLRAAFARRLLQANDPDWQLGAAALAQIVDENADLLPARFQTSEHV